jgi:hypothetical protein
VRAFDGLKVARKLRIDRSTNETGPIRENTLSAANSFGPLPTRSSP